MQGPSVAEESTKRRKRKWDQPDESLVSANITVPGFFPLSNMGLLGGSGISVAASGTVSANPLTAIYVNKPDVTQAMLIPMQAATVVQKLTQPKIQEELIIAREIIINDAEPADRYKLTKRQTQEEIQKRTGAVVITRGKYRPPNAMPDGDKPLYLHISAGAHLTDTAERILAVDRAAAIVDEMLRPAPKVYSTCVYLGFDADPSLDIPTRIRGPNDQYINHIISETGATVSLRGGGGSGNAGTNLEEGDQHQPLHLFLSSNNHKALEDARRLAENLLDTISRECGLARVLPCKVYTAVPPPQELLIGTHGPGVPPISSASSIPLSSIVAPSIANQNGLRPLCTGVGTSYSGYSGIYPQATPLQQVALALKQSCGMNCVATATEVTRTGSGLIIDSPPEKDKKAPQKRKFQELPAASGGSRFSHQATESVELIRPMTVVADKPRRDLFFMPPPKKPANLSSGVMPPPPPPPPSSLSITKLKSVVDKSAVSSPPSSRGLMPPPPALPKINHSRLPAVQAGDEDNSSRLKPETVPDTLVKLLEYGEDDDSDDEDPNEGTRQNSLKPVNKSLTGEKPFWAV